MTRADLARAIHERHGGITLKEAGALVDLVLERMASSLLEEGKMMISGFGTLKVLERGAKRGINPQSGKPMTIPRRRTVVLRPSISLLRTLNGDGP